MPSTTYQDHAVDLNRELRAAIPAEKLAELHRRRSWLHCLIALRQVVLLVGLPVLIHRVDAPWVWIPACVLLGFVVFSFSILLHEAVHRCVFRRDRWGLTPLLGLLYGWVSGLAYSQFRRWHLDHHTHLGSTTADPKRAHLSPPIHARWYKLLYCTPALFPIYFRAVARTLVDYPQALRGRIRLERAVGTALHLGLLAWFYSVDPWFALKGYILPVFFVFPVAFTLNRLGQHYVIDPEEVAHWSTLMRSNGVWNFLFLFSTHHLEHHYFPGVPFYNLPRLQQALGPFFEAKNTPSLGYFRLLHLWFVRNHEPHTRLDLI